MFGKALTRPLFRPVLTGWETRFVFAFTKLWPGQSSFFHQLLLPCFAIFIIRLFILSRSGSGIWGHICREKVLGYTAIRLEHKPVIYWQLIYGKTFFLQRTMIAFNIFNESYILYTVHVYKHIHTSNDYPNYSRHAMHYIIAINNILFLPFCLLMKLFFPCLLKLIY